MIGLRGADHGPGHCVLDCAGCTAVFDALQAALHTPAPTWHQSVWRQRRRATTRPHGRRQ